MANALPEFDFGLGEDLAMLRASVRGLGEKEAAPRAAEIDREDVLPRDLWPKFGELGLHGIAVEEEWGGSGLGYLAEGVALEEISPVSASVGLSYGALANH